jgi:hypothetical protein
MEYNVGALLTTCILLIIAFIAMLVALYSIISSKKLENEYKKIAVKILPGKLNSFFGYNGRVFSIESSDRYESNGKISDIKVLVDAFKVLDEKLYLSRNFQCTPHVGHYRMDKLYEEMCLFARQPDNRGKFVIYNKLTRSYNKPAAFKLNSSDKHQYYLITL